MIEIRHTGIYVNDLCKETEFYKKVFSMHVICENVIQHDQLTNAILKNINSKIVITKLITNRGKICRHGDMIELIQVVENTENITNELIRPLYLVGCMHIALSVDDIEKTVNLVVANGGEIYTEILLMDNGNKCCFCLDPEKNYLELIENK